MELVFLADYQKAIPTIARWYFDEWGHWGKGKTLDEIADNLQLYLNDKKMPLMIVAVEDGEILGAAQLKFREMDIYPEKEHWLGGVYVATAHRGRNIAEKLILKILDIARLLNVETLYLQTERMDGGLYRRLGWQPVEQANNHGIDVLVMEKRV